MQKSIIYLRNDLRSSIERFDSLHERIIRFAVERARGASGYAVSSLSESFGLEIDADLATGRFAHLDDEALPNPWRGERDPADHLWIVHEAPPSVLAVLERHRQSYIEFRLSPIRFANDLMLALTTNNRDIAARIRPDGVGRAECQVAADLLRLRSRLRGAEAPASHLAGAALVVGQVDFDLSLIDRMTGERLDLTRFPDTLRAALGERRAFYKPHPYAAAASVGRDIAFLRETLSADIVVVQENIYDLFCAVTDLLVVAVSSGALQEASLFGLPTHCLHQPFVPLDWMDEDVTAESGPGEGRYIQVPYALFADPATWGRWLGDPAPAAVRPPIHLQPRDLLRELYRNSWGFWPHWDQQEMRDHDVAQGPRMASWAFSTMSFADFAQLMRGAFGDSGVVMGVWRWFAGWDVTFRGDGVFTVNGGDAGRYVFFGGRALVLYYREPGLQDFVWLSADGQSLSGFNSKGVAVSASRLHEMR